MDRAFQGRHEIKFLLSDFAAAALSERLAGVLQRDEHADRNGEYGVRSVYFDDLADSALYDKIDGVKDREKYRIRIYNGRDDVIYLERKQKRGDIIAKQSVPLSRRAAERLLQGDLSPLCSMKSPVAKNFYAHMRSACMAPRVIVEYDREAFWHPAEHTRVTFDRRIATGMYETNLFEENFPRVTVLPPFTQVMEVKYDNYLPDIIMPLLSAVRADRMAISKYTLCRMHEL
ncbi:MAG: polyphosphate polymerase domain-containing protein [Christensenellales bacterium]